MGRYARAHSGRTTLNIDPKLKARATLYAIRHGLTLSQLIEQGLKLAMREANGR